MPPEKTKDVLDFATKKPRDRLESIKNGLTVSSAVSTKAKLTVHRQGIELRSIRIRPPIRYECKYQRTIDGQSTGLEASHSTLRPY